MLLNYFGIVMSVLLDSDFNKSAQESAVKANYFLEKEFVKIVQKYRSFILFKYY